MAALAPVTVSVVNGMESSVLGPISVGVVVDAITAVQGTTRMIAPRSRRALHMAAKRGLLLVAHRGGVLIGWAMGEPSGPGVVELGSLYVVPESRDGVAMRDLTALGTSLRPTSVVVTMDRRFAQWLRNEWGFEQSTLWGVTCATRGAFLARRLAPWRLIAAIRHVTEGSPCYLIRREVDGL